MAAALPTSQITLKQFNEEINATKCSILGYKVKLNYYVDGDPGKTFIFKNEKGETIRDILVLNQKVVLLGIKNFGTDKTEILLFDGNEKIKLIGPFDDTFFGNWEKVQLPNSNEATFDTIDKTNGLNTRFTLMEDFTIGGNLYAEGTGELTAIEAGKGMILSSFSKNETIIFDLADDGKAIQLAHITFDPSADGKKNKFFTTKPEHANETAIAFSCNGCNFVIAINHESAADIKNLISCLGEGDLAIKAQVYHVYEQALKMQPDEGLSKAKVAALDGVFGIRGGNPAEAQGPASADLAKRP